MITLCRLQIDLMIKLFSSLTILAGARYAFLGGVSTVNDLLLYLISLIFCLIKASCCSQISETSNGVNHPGLIICLAP